MVSPHPVDTYPKKKVDIMLDIRHSSPPVPRGVNLKHEPGPKAKTSARFLIILLILYTTCDKKLSVSSQKEEIMSPHLECPKNFGAITFVITSSSSAALGWCPVSGKGDCVECNVSPKGDLGEGRQVKRKEK